MLKWLGTVILPKSQNLTSNTELQSLTRRLQKDPENLRRETEKIRLQAEAKSAEEVCLCLCRSTRTTCDKSGFSSGLAGTGNTEIGFTIICPSTEDGPTQAGCILDLILQLVNQHPRLVLVRPYGHLWWVFCGRTRCSVVGGVCERPLWLCSLCT